jgi:hypothetical protein
MGVYLAQGMVNCSKNDNNDRSSVKRRQFFH